MASTYTYPQDYVYWYLLGRQLAIVTTDTDDSDNDFETINESVDDGILVEYEGTPDLLDPEDKDILNKSIPCHPVLHGAIIDYVRSQLYLEKDGEQYMLKANMYYTKFKNKVLQFNGGKPDVEIRITKPPKQTSLRL